MRKAYRSGSSLLQDLGLHESEINNSLDTDSLYRMVMRHAKVDPLKTPTIELSPEDIRSLTNRISVNPTDTGTTGYLLGQLVAPSATAHRSEERRGGNEGASTCRYRWSPNH